MSNVKHLHSYTTKELKNIAILSLKDIVFIATVCMLVVLNNNVIYVIVDYIFL